MNLSQAPFWSVPSSELLQQLQTTPQGLMSDEAQQRLLRYGSNLLKPRKKSDALTLLFLAELLGFQPLPMTILLVIGMIVVLYIIAAEITKRSFYKRVNF